MIKHKPIRLNAMGKTLEMQGEDAELILQALQIEKMLREGAVKEAEVLRVEKAEILEALGEMLGPLYTNGTDPALFLLGRIKARDVFNKYAPPENAEKPVPLQIITP